MKFDLRNKNIKLRFLMGNILVLQTKSILYQKFLH